MDHDKALEQFAIRMGDNALVLGHRVSEWCGHAPVIEEDIALANTALDLIGQTQLWLGLAAEIGSEGKSADDLAFLRDVWDFRNLLLLEMPNGDFGQTLMRQFLFDAWQSIYLPRLAKSNDARVAAIAEKTAKEAAYHVERSADTVVGLGDGTEESHKRMQAALDYLWPFVGEVFATDDVDNVLAEAGTAVHPLTSKEEYYELVRRILTEATLDIPDSDFAHKGGRSGQRHTEHLGHMLTEMQWLQRAYPGATW